MVNTVILNVGVRIFAKVYSANCILYKVALPRFPSLWYVCCIAEIFGDKFFYKFWKIQVSKIILKYLVSFLLFSSVSTLDF